MQVITDNIYKYDIDWWNTFYSNHTHIPTKDDRANYEWASRKIGEGSVIEVGCGEGWFSEYVIGNYLGIDWSPKAIEKATKRFPTKKFKRGTFEDVEGKWNYGVAFEIFEHLNNPEELVKTLQSVSHHVIVALPYAHFGKVVVDNDKPLLSQFLTDLDYHYATYDETDILKMFPDAQIFRPNPHGMMFIL